MLSNLKEFFKLVRWFHELLAILPFVALYLIINYFIQQNALSCNLSSINFIIVCFGVQLLLATGCILNDIMDRDIDAINKPNTHIVGRTISLKSAKLLFIVMTALVIISSIYISLYIFKEWAFISISVYALSILYDVYFKRAPLIGNILMATLAAFIPLVILFFAKECIIMLNNERIEVLIYLYALFPFLIIIPRELSLDISDMEGDKADGCKTLPIVIGVKKSKHVVIAFLLLVVILSVFLMYSYNYFVITCIMVDIMLVYYIYKLQRTEKRIDYIKIGRFLWFIMIIGLIGSSIATIYL